MFLRTVLVDKTGDTVPMTLRRIEGKLYIHDGWEDFYDTHSLRRGDVVMFALRDNNVIEVKCFCWCSIERDDFEGRQTHAHHLHPGVFDDDGSAAGEQHEQGDINVPDENEVENEMVEGQVGEDVEHNQNLKLIHCDNDVANEARDFRSENFHFIRRLPKSTTIPAEAAAYFDRGNTDITFSTLEGGNFVVKLVNGSITVHCLVGGISLRCIMG
ncbi:hypothetical protein COLO4_07543 [Corchorus olitorius]|uniref:TF-B3 domain-containing protein n=1 Tax=Corchorus olitorius TaxID=93759 RepID=A0A1R3KJC6_9ROSI|nr:hypothetical protein COLO4_07543 [Corchorus olitorius]